MKKLALLSVVLLAVAAVAQNNISLPAGTTLKVKLVQTLTTSSKSGDHFSGRVTEPVMLDGKAVVPIGATVQGRVINASEPRRVSGKPTITIFPDTLVMPNGDYLYAQCHLGEHGSVQRYERQQRRPVQGQRVRQQRSDRDGGGHRWRHARRRANRRRQRRSDWRSGRRNCDRDSLVGQEELGHAACGH